MVECIVRLLVAHLAHRSVELEATVLDSGSLEIDNAHFIAHDIAVSATDDSDFRSVTHLTP